MSTPMSSSPGRAHGLLLLGFLLVVLANVRWGVPALAWVAPAPLLAALRVRSDARFAVTFVVGLVLAWSLATLKIVTPPVPWPFAFAYGVPIALVHAPAYLLWRRLAARGRDGLAILGFAAASSLAEWAQAELTPLGTWGSAPVSQVGQLPVLQLLALVGAPGLSFAVHAVAASIEAAWAGRLAPRPILGVAMTAVAALSWGAWRAERPIEGREVRAAAVRTDATFGGLPLPSPEEVRAVDSALFERTRAAAAAGATLVVWPEAATVVTPEEEAGFRERVAGAAGELGVELVTAYIVPVATAPLRYENKLAWAGPDGRERLTYHKHHPVPAEPATAGPAPAPVLATALGALSAAICYDYDFPALGRAHARGGAGLVVVPSSDWRGIDPAHTGMAAMRAIEGGFSILRSTRFGLSAGIDAHGRFRAAQSTNESAEPFLLVTLPAERVPTLYTWLGNAVLVPLVALLAWAALVAAGVRAPRWGAPGTNRVMPQEQPRQPHAR